MNTSILEITENEYCIKLNKNVFELSLVQQLIKRIQAESYFFKSPFQEEDDIISRRNQKEESRGFDRLDDK